MIRWIDDRLGTAAFDRTPPGDYRIIDVRHLVDKGGNAAGPVRACIDSGVEAWKSGATVVVACDFGVSRSNSIAAGILSILKGVSLDEAVDAVMTATGETEIKLDMVQTVRAALSGDQQPARAGRILVTGGSGFIGQALISRLGQSHEIRAPGRADLDLEQGSVKLAAYCEREGVSQIVHLAYPRIYTNVAAMAGGIAMLRIVLDTCKNLGIRLVFVSGAVVFSGYTGAVAAEEDLPMLTRGVYGDAKLLEETLVGAYAQREDVRRSVCRLSAVYGPGGDRPRLINTFRQAIEAGEVVRTHLYNNGQPKLDLLYISDAVEAIARTVEHEGDEIFHFGSGELHSSAQIAGTIAELVGKPLRHEELHIDEDIADVVMIADKARRVLGWEPQVGLRRGLAQTLRLEQGL